MKNNILYILTALLLTATGCYKDNGNYDYIVLNKVTLSDTAARGALNLTLKDTLKLEPAVQQSGTQTDANLTWLWQYYEVRADGGPSQYISLSSVKKLVLPINGSGMVLGKTYQFVSQVKDNNTGVSTYLYYTVNIVNEFSQGWMILEEQTGNSRMSFILPNDTVVRGFVQYPIGSPFKLELCARALTDDLSPSGRRLYVIGENSGYELDYQTLQKKFDYKDLFYQLPSVVKMQYLNWPSSIGIAINDGIVHSNLTGGFPGAKKWGAPLLSVKGDYNYKVALDVAGAIGENGFTTYPSIVYDNTNKCFSYVGSAIGGAGAALTRFPEGASGDKSIFDMNNVGLTMLYMDSANLPREFNAVMKDASNMPYLLRFKTAYRTATESQVLTLQKYQMNAPDILNMSAATNSTSTAHLFYSVGNKVYRHEIPSNTTTASFSFAAGEQVTRMDFIKSMPGRETAVLVVATWNGTEGKVYYFPVSATGEITNFSKVFTGFLRIKDLVFKVPGA